MKKLSLTTKVLISLGIVGTATGLTFLGMKLYSQSHKIGEYKLDIHSSFSTDFGDKKTVSKGTFINPDTNVIVGSLDVTLDYSKEENKKKAIKVQEEGKTLFLSEDQFQKWYGNKYNGGTPNLVLEIGPMKFINEYYEALSPSEFLDYANWFMENVSWGPDIITLKAFTLKKGVKAEGSSLTLGAHYNHNKEETYIEFYPDSFFGSLPLYSIQAGRGQARDSLLHKINEIPFSKEELDQYISSIPKRLKLTNSRNTLLGQPFLEKALGRKIKAISLLDFIDPNAIVNLKNKYGDHLEQFTYFFSFDEKNDSFIKKAKTALLAFAYDNDIKTIFENEESFSIPEDSIKEGVVKNVNLNEEINPNTKIYKKGSFLISSMVDEKEQEWTLYFEDFFVSKNASKSLAINPLNFFNSNLDPKANRKFNFLRAIELADLTLSEVADTSDTFRDLYGYKSFLNSKILNFEKAFVRYEKDGKFKYFSSDAVALSEEGKLDYSKLTRNVLIKSYSVTNDNKKMTLKLQKFEKEENNIKYTDIEDLVIDFTDAKTEKENQEKLNQLKSSLGWLDVISPKIIKKVEYKDSNGETKSGYDLYYEAYSGLLDTVMENDPFIGRVQNKEFVEKVLNTKNNTYEYKLVNKEHRTFEISDRIPFIKLLKLSSNQFKTTGNNYLKYVGAHEYGHHLTLQYAQDISEKENSVALGAIDNRSGISTAQFYDIKNLSLYLAARNPKLKIRQADLNLNEDKNGLFINFSKEGNEFETIDDIYGGDDNATISDIVKNNRRFIVNLDFLKKVAEERKLKLSDIFVLNSLDNQSATISPTIQGEVKVMKNDGTFIPATKKSELLNDVLKDGMGNVIKFDSNSKPILIEYTKDKDDIVTSITPKVFLSNGSPIIDFSHLDNLIKNRKINSYAIDLVLDQLYKKFNSLFYSMGYLGGYTGLEVPSKNISINGANSKEELEKLIASITKEFTWKNIDKDKKEKINNLLTSLSNSKLDNILSFVNEKEIENINLLDKIKYIADGKAQDKESIFYSFFTNGRQEADIDGILNKHDNFSQEEKQYLKNLLITFSTKTKDVGTISLFSFALLNSPFFKTIDLANKSSFYVNPKYDSIIQFTNGFSINSGEFLSSKSKKFVTPFSQIFKFKEGENSYSFGPLSEFEIKKSDENKIYLNYWDERKLGFSKENNFFQKDKDNNTIFDTLEKFIEFASIDPLAYKIVEKNGRSIREWNIEYALSKFDLLEYGVKKGLFKVSDEWKNINRKSKDDIEKFLLNNGNINARLILQEIGNNLLDSFEDSTLNMFMKNAQVSDLKDIRHLLVKNQGLTGFNNFAWREGKRSANKSEILYNMKFSNYNGETYIKSFPNNFYFNYSLNEENPMVLVNQLKKYLDENKISSSKFSMQLIQLLLGTKTYWITWENSTPKSSNLMIAELNYSSARNLALLNRERYLEKVNDYMTNYSFQFSEILTRDYVQLTYSPSDKKMDNIHNFIGSGISEKNSGLDYFISRDLSEKWKYKLNMPIFLDSLGMNGVSSDINKVALAGLWTNLSKESLDQFRNQVYSDLIEFTFNSENNSSNIDKEYQEKIQKVKDSKPNDGANEVEKFYFEKDKNEEIKKLEKEHKNKLLLSKIEFENDQENNVRDYLISTRLSNPSTYVRIYEGALDPYYIGNDVSSNSGFTIDRWMREELDWKIYNDDTSSIKDLDITLKDLQDKLINDRARATWMYLLKSQGIGDRTLSGIFRDKDKDAMTMWGFAPKDEVAKISKIAIQSLDKKSTTYINVNTRNTNNLFYFEKQADQKTKRTIEDEGYSSWASDFAILSSFKNSIAKPGDSRIAKYRLFFVDKDNKEITNLLSIGSRESIAENGKIKSQAPVYIEKERGETYLVVRNQFNV